MPTIQLVCTSIPYRCSADRQKKHAAGEFKQIEVTDDRGTRRMMFTKELQPHAANSASMRNLMLTAPPHPSEPRINPK